MTPGGSYDMAGVWRPDVGSGLSTVYFNKFRPYDHSLYSTYYTLEDDYYGSYGDLLEYEDSLRLSRELSHEERLRRWQQRLAFEELEHEQRIRRYERMSDIERQRLGLVGRSWWAARYGGGHHQHSGWRERFGDRLTHWTTDRLPLSSTLGHRFGSMWEGRNESLRRASDRVEDNLMRSEHRINETLYRQEDRLSNALREQDRYLERSLEEDRLNRRIEEDRLNQRIQEEDRMNQMNDELRFERQRFDQEGYIEDRLEDQILENRALEDRLYDDQTRFGLDDRYREAELESYERERGF
ncbi:hypothetical protein DFH28DRAFT_879980 [Melampsora americana]|nr:hypothetical protein DFH28DRAFT_879980 [Melampsora americana]